MNTQRFEFAEIVKLLRCSENDPKIRSFFGEAMSRIKRDEYYGALEFDTEGVDAVFVEAPWVVPLAEITDPKVLYLSAFHLHRAGHEGFAGYTGQLPNGVALGDLEAEVLGKMGQPSLTGGGGMSTVLPGPIPRWFRYSIGSFVLHFQLDTMGRVEMVTVSAPDVRPT
ncbi:MAG: hypothetical protein ABSH20_09270 [Tepidisphaeraceae bacterium]|jgi:hypothetical protein